MLSPRIYCTLSLYFHHFLRLLVLPRSQPVPSQPENRFLNRQGSGDGAEEHYWPHLDFIATTMAPLDNGIDSVTDAVV